jgi:hypothetical protein
MAKYLRNREEEKSHVQGVKLKKVWWKVTFYGIQAALERRRARLELLSPANLKARL